MAPKVVGPKPRWAKYALEQLSRSLTTGSQDAVFTQRRGSREFSEVACTAFSSGGDKNLKGGLGNDIVVGGRGSDNVLGDTGNDFLVDGPTREFSEDKVLGGDGNDVFLVENAPADKDIVTCGGGFDRVLADRKDLVSPDCERVRIAHGSREEVLQQEEEFLASIPPSFFEGLYPGAF